MSVQTEINRLNAIKERIRTNLVAQGVAVPSDAKLEEMATQILSVAGENGQRGTGILKATTSPSAYTTAIGSYTPKYRIALSTLKTQSGVNEVLIGDIIEYSYYHYTIDYLDASYAYISATRVSFRGATGAAGSDYVLTDADKAEIASMVTVEGIPEYWQSALDEGVEAINTALCNAGYNKSAFLFYTDCHWNYGSQRSPSLLKYLYQHTGMNKTFFGGDIVNNEADDYDTMAYLWDWRNQLKGLPNHHSVTGNHDDGNTTNNLFDEKYVYGFLLAAEETPDIVRGKDGLYYYIDSPTEKTRYLFLDTAFQSVYYSDTQKAFVDNALLTTPTGWHIVAIAHIWHDTDYSVTPAVPIGHSLGGAYLLGRFDAYNSRQGEFADCGGWVEFCIGGHTHWDFDSTSEGGIPVLLMETDSKHVRSGLGYTAGTTTENSVSGIIADYDAKTIKVVRIGRGASREVEMTWHEVSYTNILKEVGYKENTRLSASSGFAEREQDGVDLTGYIPVKFGDVLRFKNMTVPQTTTGYGNTIYLFDTSKTGTNSAPVTDLIGVGYWTAVWDEGNLVELKYGGDTGFIRINATNIDDTSIITINEPIE
jgi:hypothetical protein